MRIHTTLSEEQLRESLARAKESGTVAPVIEPIVLSEFGSHTHPHAFEVQLGSQEYDRLPEGYLNQYGKRQRTRRRNHPNTAWAATYQEWGGFLAEVFRADPDAMVGNPRGKASPWGYDGAEHFHELTNGAFKLAVHA